MELTAFVIHPENSDYFLAGSRTVQSFPLQNQSDLWRSTAGPREWTRLGDGGTAFALDPRNPNTLYHSEGNPSHVYETTNVWENESAREITPAEGIGDVNGIAVDMDSNVYVAATDGLWKWSGGSWMTLTGLPSSDVTALVIDYDATPGILYAAADDEASIFYSKDGGATWTDYSDSEYFPSVRRLLVSDGYLYAVPADGGVWKRKAVPTGVSVEDPHEIPGDFTLSQNYPNPFNPSTTLRYSIPHPSRVRLTIHDVLGRLVETLVDREVAAGVHEIAFRSERLASGPYLYRLETPTETISRIMVVLR